MKNILFGTTILTILAFSNAATSCSYVTCEKGDQFRSFASLCGKVYSVGFTDDEKQEIVDKHNDLRLRVEAGLETKGNPGPQPPASNMQDMVWDDSLACMAQKWANLCKFDHDPCRLDDRFFVGQNIAMTMTTGVISTTPGDIVQMWYNEVSDMDKNQVSDLIDIEGIGHYTQVVWAKTNMVGCGKIEYQPAGDWKKYYVVCNYGPGGNILGDPVYEIDKN